MDAVKIKELIRNFVVETFLLGDTDTKFTDDESFLENGIVDSTGILELITYVEEKFNISIDEEEMIPDNLDSLNNLSNFIQKKQI